MSAEQGSGDDAHPSPEMLFTGRPSAAETAAVVLALTAVSQAQRDAGRSADPGRSLWNSRARAARPPLTPGPGAWRASRMPR